MIYLAQQFGICWEKAIAASLAVAGISHVGFSALIIGQRYFTIGTPTLNSANTAISAIETVILGSLCDIACIVTYKLIN
ncbi:MAG: hypothetical protein HY088_04325 [Ignavibacteriales bacterium]|nr:hypothetical protein [Ignavibacteriales bacterium]